MKNYRKTIAKLLVILYLITNTFTAFTNYTSAEEFTPTEINSIENTESIKDNVEDKVVNIKEKVKKAIDRKDKKNHKVDLSDKEKTQVIVKYKDSSKEMMSTTLSKEEKEAEFKQKKEKIKKDIKKKLKSKKLETKKEFKLQKIDIIETEEQDIESLLEELSKSEEVEYVQPNYKLSVNSVPTDASFSQQWSLLNTGQEIEGEIGRAGVDVNIIPAWDITKGNTDVIIGVLDTGIDIYHEDLTENIYINSGEIADNGIDDDGNGYIDDLYGWDFVNGDNSVYDGANYDMHGTAVAGIIAAVNNEIGITGIAPNVKIMPLKFINGTSGYTCDAIEAIEYAMLNGVKIINCSFGGSDNNYALKDSMENSGILFVASAGNRGGNVLTHPTYPACFDIPNILSVASITNIGVKSEYSGYGKYIDVAAPGENIFTTMPENLYNTFSGTSAATAHVTGITALLKSYLPDLTYTEISDRIKENVVVCNTLQDKVDTNGRVDAFAALSNTKPQPDTYEDTSGDTPVDPGDNGFNDDSWYTMDQLAKIKEQLHYGKSGVNPATGNYSFTVNDMSMSAPGFQVNISRTYNAKSEQSTLLGRGWTFGFEGNIQGENNILVSLPNGSVQSFRKQIDGTYKPEDNRSSFVKNGDNSFTLTTKDQYAYKFNTNKQLTEMKDPKGNTVTIELDAQNKITKIKDIVGREFVIEYNASGFISTITDPIGRKVTYNYENNLLKTVTDPVGSQMKYSYDTHGFLNEIRDNNDTLVETLKYNHTTGYDQGKVIEAKDGYGSITKYTYDTVNQKTTIIENNNNKLWVYWYDKSNYITEIQDPVGDVTKTEYYTVNGENKYGDIKNETDKYGNITAYEIDDRGNVTKITYPDGGTKVFNYDDKNNLIKEKDQENKTKYYIYDSEKIYLLKEVLPLNGTDEYIEGQSIVDNFSITLYSYYTDAEAQAQGCSAKGLIKSITDPEGNITTYTYDQYGNIKTVTDPESNTTTYTNNQIGWKLNETTPKQFITTYTYNNNGQLTKVVYHGGETRRIDYDILGRKTKEISPNQYNEADEDTINNTYNGNYGDRYTYYINGLLKTETDPMDNTTEYTYDIYGNIETKTIPNGGVYLYTYDKLDRIIKIEFKEASDSEAVTLEEYSYSKTADNKELIKHTLHLNNSEKAETFKTFDFAGRLIKEEYPDGTRETITYYKNGEIKTITQKNGSTKYYYYNGLNKLEKEYLPFEIEEGQTKYSIMINSYDKAGRKIEEKIGVDKVILNDIPQKFITVNYSYYKNGKIKESTKNSGSKASYIYDLDGNLIRTEEYIDDTNKRITEFEYDHLGRMSRRTIYVDAKDIYENSLDSTDVLSLVTTYTYDGNGNLKSVTNADANITTYEYDLNNNQISVSNEIEDKDANIESIIWATTYDYEGKPLSKTDPQNNTTTYEYSKRGFLEKVIDSLGGTTIFQYDLAGRRIGEVTPKNFDVAKSFDEMNRIEYTYDKMDRLKTKEYHYKDSNSIWQHIVLKAYKYNAMGQAVKELDALGYKAGTGSTVEQKINSGYGVTTTYNLAGKVKTILDPVAKDRSKSFTNKYVYDGKGRKIAEINGNDAITNYYYDDNDNVTKISRRKNVDSEEKILGENTYDKIGNLLTQTDAVGNTTIYSYNKLGKVRSITYPSDETIDENIETYQYDKLGNTRSIINSLGKQVLNTYDTLGRLISSTEQKQTGEEAITVAYTYDKNNNVISSTDGNGNVRTYIHDKLNRKIEEQYNVGSITKNITYGYDSNSNLTDTTDWRGNTYIKVYDAIDRLIEEKDPYGKSIQKLEYNINSAQSKSIDALGNVTLYQYDKNNRLIYTTDPLGKVEGITYDDVGNTETKTDKNNRTTTYIYDENNNLTKVLTPEGTKTEYKYDLNNNLISKIDGNENETIYVYNVRNQLAKEVAPGGRTGEPGYYIYAPSKTNEYTYYADGALKTRKDPNGQNFTYTYDIHQRLIEEKIYDNVLKAYTYDNNSNKLSVTDGIGTTTFTYDEENRLLTKNIPNIGILTYTYDIIELVLEGEVKYKITDPKGNETVKTLDRAGRLKTVENSGEATSYIYNDNGSRKEVIYPNGLKETFNYNDRGEVTTLTNKKADGTTIEEYAYTYDNNGNQLSKNESIGITNYTYDSLNRLKTVTEPNGKETTYTFDGAGNRTAQIISDAGDISLTKYTYNSQNHLKMETTQYLGNTKITNYEYDSNGNLVSKSAYEQKPSKDEDIEDINISTAGDGKTKDITLYEYDLYNQLTKTITDNKTVTYSYDSQGYRIEKAVKTIDPENKVSSTESSRYIYSGDKVILETDLAGNTTAINVYGMNLISRVDDGSKRYYLYNAHADVTGLADIDGNITDTYRYDAFGNIIAKTGEASNPYTYAGYRYDEESDLYYLNARYYDAKVARFLTVDTYKGQLNDPLSLNLYTYCVNNPIIYIDPSGHRPIRDDSRERPSYADKNSTVKYGSSGSDVVKLQAKLKDLGYDVGTVDGKFGPKTNKALKEFQKDNGLDSDGIAGNKTWDRINSNPTSKLKEEKRNSNSSTSNINTKKSTDRIDSSTTTYGTYDTYSSSDANVSKVYSSGFKPSKKKKKKTDIKVKISLMMSTHIKAGTKLVDKFEVSEGQVNHSIKMGINNYKAEELKKKEIIEQCSLNAVVMGIAGNAFSMLFQNSITANPVVGYEVENNVNKNSTLLTKEIVEDVDAILKKPLRDPNTGRFVSKPWTRWNNSLKNIHTSTKDISKEAILSEKLLQMYDDFKIADSANDELFDTMIKLGDGSVVRLYRM